jgi:serine/threonine protein kinase
MMHAERGPIRVVGRYALYNEIAAGGMATVHIGRLLGPVGFARTVAVKRLHPQFAKDPEFVSMFLDEARLAARVQHPNVVATIDVVATDGELFLIMDYVRGESLSKLVRTAKKLGVHMPPRIAAAIICGFLHGLHAAHEAKNERGERLNLVHRDVSPQNVLVGADGIARVLDFGIAKAAGRVQVTKDGQIKGKLAYMPPEQLSGREITRGVDIYASAVVMWEAITGERLFKGETEGETLSKILRDPVLPPSALVPNLPKAFDGPLMQALSRDPKERQKTARELALQLEKCAGMASPTEVGEWVEAIVGPAMSAREEQIAAIESSSALLRSPHTDSGRPMPMTPDDSSSDVSAIPSSRSNPYGMIGPTSGAMPHSSGRYPLGPPTPTATAPLYPQGMAPQYAEQGPTTGTGTGTKMTGSMSLPVDRKLPVLGILAGLMVLLVVMAVVVAGRLEQENKKAAQPVPSASVSASAPAASTASEIPPPPSVATPEASAQPTSPPASAEPAAQSTATSRPTATTRPTATQAPVVRPTATATATATATQTAKPPAKNCDPPWIIDDKGHRQYKRECL